jgi:putative ATPase
LQGQVFYQPSAQGFEAGIKTQVERQREAQLAALLEGIGVALPESLTFAPVDSARERWLQRALGQAGERLAGVRDRLFALAEPQRHHVILDLNAGSGLLTWEAIRRVPEGGVYACVHSPTDATALTEQIAALPELHRPVILQTSLTALPAVLNSQAGVRFDRILGRNSLTRQPDKAAIVQVLLSWLQPMGAIALAETIPRHTQRLYRLLDPDWFSPRLFKKLVAAEEAIYAQTDDPMLNWDVEDLQTIFAAIGLKVEISLEQSSTEMQITLALLDRWFAEPTTQPTYQSYLAQSLSSKEIAQVYDRFTRLLHQTICWQSAIAFVYAH